MQRDPRTWIKPAIAIVVLSMAVHVIFTAMALAGYTLRTGDFGGPILLSVWIYFAIFAGGVWIAKRLWHRWLPALSGTLTAYAALGLLRIPSPDPSDLRAVAFIAANRQALLALVFWGIVAAIAWRWRRERRQRTAD